MNWTMDQMKGIAGVYGQNALSNGRISFWFHEFKGGRDSVVDLPRAAKPIVAPALCSGHKFG